MPDLHSLIADLDAEGAVLDALVAPLGPDGWAAPTPAPDWTVAHQIAHLAWTDGQALLAVTDPAAFSAARDRLPPDAVDAGAAEGAGEDPARLLERWRTGRRALSTALAQVPAGTKIPWFGPPMGAASMATARLMETWAHGLDVAETLGVRPRPTDRLRHVAHLGVRTRDYAFRINDLPPPREEFRVELTGPDGQEWTWGPADARQSVSGPALDFCLLAVRRRHRDEVALLAKGPDADRWLDLVQAFAGLPGPGRPPSAGRV